MRADPSDPVGTHGVIGIETPQGGYFEYGYQVCVDRHYQSVDVEDIWPIDNAPEVETAEEINRIERKIRKKERDEWYF